LRCLQAPLFDGFRLILAVHGTTQDDALRLADTCMWY
jgi:hypothetical protein